MTDIATRESFSIEVERLSNETGNRLIETLVERGTFYGVTDKINNYLTRPLREKLELEAIKFKTIRGETPVVGLYE